MTEATRTPGNRTRHILALVAGIGALIAFFAIPGGIVGYALMIAVGVLAVLVGHGSVRRSGSVRWAAILGLTLAYLELIVAVGLLTVRLARVFTS